MSLAFALATGRARADDAVLAQLGERYETQVRGVLKQFCYECHAGEEAEGEVDFSKYNSLADVRRDVRTWQKILDVLSKGDMPPKDAKQPEARERHEVEAWIGRWLAVEARSQAGDPGLVLLRRLNNVEYTNTVRDLTGVDLKPAREFPVDGAAGEGFTNTGEALAMSPALIAKYLDAAKEIASHAVLLPDGFRFSASSSRRDWSDELLGQIRDLYGRYADADGKIPLEAYLSATIELREAGPQADAKALAATRKLSPKYLAALRDIFQGSEGGPILDALRSRWRATKPEGVPALAEEIRRWQASAWKFNGVASSFGTPWQEPVSPILTYQQLRQKLEPKTGSDEVVVYLVAGDAADGAENDNLIWDAPRLESVGLPPILLRDLRTLGANLMARRRQILPATDRYLAAAAEVPRDGDATKVEEAARRQGVALDALGAWVEYLGITRLAPIPSNSYFRETMPRDGGPSALRGWGSGETPNFVLNTTDQEMKTPGTIKPHGIAVHPSPALSVGMGWQSPLSGRVRVSARAIDLHASCGNGFTWDLALRRRIGGNQALGGGPVEDGNAAEIKEVGDLQVEPGDIVTLVIGPRDSGHACDLTEVELEVTPVGDPSRHWQLSKDLADDILASNPHPDRQGNRQTWHLFSEPAIPANSPAPVVPPGSVLARWRDAGTPEERNRLAKESASLLAAPRMPEGLADPDRMLYAQVHSLSGPLLSNVNVSRVSDVPINAAEASRFGLDPAGFGKGLDGKPIDGMSLEVKAPSVIEIRIPADIAEGRDFVVAGRLAGAEGSVQVQVATSPVGVPSGLLAGQPFVTRDGGPPRDRLEKALKEFRRSFPGALCFRQIVPVDEVVTMVQLFRDDEPLARLMLDDAERVQLDRLWDELHYVSQDALKVYQSYDQMLGFASQVGDTDRVEGWRKPITAAHEAFQKAQAASEPEHLAFLIRWAERAYRRPLNDRERAELPTLYKRLRAEELSHEDAFRLVLARVLVAPAFLYRAERPRQGPGSQPLSDWELASRLSYFLWSTMPDEPLIRSAGSGALHDPDALAGEARRMVGDERIRALATEFACQWLDIKDFDALEEKSERHFPTFAQVRGDMYEESIRFFVDLFRRDGSVLELIDADHTFLNEPLARFYGIPGVTGGDWRRIDGVKALGRGGIFGLGTTLAKQSGASRTSPILRGNWILESVLGERLPKPPKGVPLLPEDEASTEGLTVRQLVEKHRANVQCSGCHNRIDPFGFALEGFDAVGRRRLKDMGDRPVDSKAQLLDGTTFEDIAGLRDYVLNRKKEAFVRNFCRKLLGYALGRGVQLSDGPLIDDMTTRLREGNYLMSIALDSIVRSKAFREHRGIPRVAGR